MAGKRAGSGSRAGSKRRSSGTRYQGSRATYQRQGQTRSLTTTGGYYASRGSSGVQLGGPSGNQLELSAPGKTYHRFVLAEFIACVAMVVASIVLVPAQDSAQGSGTAARSFAKELVQLTALCIVFFVLALMASGAKTGKIAAAFGGLVTLGVAWNLSEIFGALAKALGPAVKKQQPHPPHEQERQPGE